MKCVLLFVYCLLYIIGSTLIRTLSHWDDYRLLNRAKSLSLRLIFNIAYLQSFAITDKLCLFTSRVGNRFAYGKYEIANMYKFNSSLQKNFVPKTH